MVGLSSTVPLPFNSFIGRAEELQTVQTLLATHRLVTLTGAAGIGKTRLALQAAEGLTPGPGPQKAPSAPPAYADGVYVVGLVELTDPTLLPQAVAAALGLREQPDRSLVQALTDFLASRAVLLLWDNCDYVAEGCRGLAQALLGACPQVKILATSRRSLRVQGETLYAVPPFSFPEEGFAQTVGNDAAAMLLAYEAPRLFQDRAGAILTGFTIRPEDAAAVAQICRRLDGIPLAVELAAGRIRELSAPQIAARLNERFQLLTGGASSTTHQQKLRTAIDWSNELLSATEQTLLARLSVFASGWDLEAAEQVCSGGVVAERNVLDLLTGLIDTSWVVGGTRQGARRYRMLETIREYSRERLRASGEEAQLQGRHAQFYLKLAEEADAEFTRSVRETWLDRLENEYENLRTALAWCLTDERGVETGLRLARALTRFWEVRGYFSEGRAFLAQAIGREGAEHATRERAEALNAAAVLAWMQGDFEAARALFDESLAIERTLGDTAGVAWSVHHLGHVASEQGEYETAKGLYRESLAIFRELQNQPGIAASLADQGNMALKEGDPGAARSSYEESLRISRELGDKVGIAIALNNLGKIAREQGDTRAAWALHRESLTIRLELGDKGGYPWSLEAFARLAAPTDPERAARLWGAAEALRESLGLPLPPNELEEYDRHRLTAREALGEEPFAVAWAEGQAMTPERATAFALQDGEEDPRTAKRDAEKTMAAPRVERSEPRAVAGGPVPTRLATKLALPALSPSLLPRPRLTARLNRDGLPGGRSARLALVDAAPGSGKSSLVSQWCHQQPEGSVAWLSLDREDNDPARFLLYLCAAMETAAPAAAAPVRALLQAAEQTSLEDALTLLLDGIAGLEQPVTLVLDDYHEIEAAPVHDLVSFLMAHLPPTLFLILTTRSDPPLPLARLRLQGRLIEIRDADLRFTHEEATQFLNERMGLTLPPERVDLLAERTEGWIAGLQLAALSLQGEANPSGFLDALAGSSRYLVDYLSEEVLQRQPPDVQAFLGQTAFLDRLCGPLCDAVTGAPGGQAMLQRLAAANLFLIPLDRQGRWYRYHHLFAAVLRSRLLPEPGEPLAVLHERAAAWYEAEGMAEEAIEHALSGGQFERAAPLIERLYESVWHPGLGRSLERWLRALPPTLIRTRPYLSFVLASLHYSHFRAAAAEQVLNECRFEPQDAGEPRSDREAVSGGGRAPGPATRDLHGKLLMARGWTARLLGDKERSARLSSEALDLLPVESHNIRSYARFNLAMLYQEGEHLAAAGEAYADAVREAQQGGHFVLRVRASYGAGQLREAQGALREATRLYEEALEYARERHILHTSAAGLLYAGLGRIRYQRNELNEAAVDLAEGLERVDSALAETNPIYAVPCCLELLRLQTALGNTATADAMLERLEKIARAIEVPCLESLLALMRVRQQAGEPRFGREADSGGGRSPGPAEVVSAWLTAFEARTEGVALPPVPIPEVRVPDFRGLEIVTWARFRLAQGGTAEVGAPTPGSKVVIAAVEAGLERSLEAMVEQGRDGTALELRVLRATLHWQAGQREQAIAVLEPALELAEREGYVRVFVEAGSGLIPVLRQAAAQGIAPETMGTLLAALGKADRATGAPPDRGSPALIEPLSERELEVLRLLAAGLSNNEIAAQLYLAVGTVKQHLNHIYGKLEVTSRTAAVARARALSLL